MTEATLLRRSPPHSAEAECSVLGASLIDPRVLDVVAVTLRSEHFYSEARGTVYTALLEMRNAGTPADQVTLVDYLRRKGLLEAAGGASTVAELCEAVPTTANAEHYARQVVEFASLRELMRAALEVHREAQDAHGSAAEILDRAEKRVFDVTQKRVTQQRTPSLPDLISAVFRNFDLARRGGTSGLPTGLDALDRVTGGLRPGEVTVLAARPSMGKSTLATTILRNVTMDSAGLPARPALFVSLEMPAVTVIENCVGAIARVSPQRIRHGDVDQDGYDRMAEAAARLERAPFRIEAPSSLSTMEFRALCRRIKAETPLALVVVDYLQLMTATSTAAKQSRQEEVAEVSRAIKAVARELDVPVIALAQINRKAEDRPGSKPRMSDLRESGAIEADADVILLLHREEYYNRDKPELKGKATVNVVKNRNGPTDEVELAFFGEHMRFENAER